MNVRLVDLGVTKDPLNGEKKVKEEILAKVLGTVTSERGIEVDTLEERVDFNVCLINRR